MSKLIVNVPELIDSYKRWISSNSSVVSDVETTIKWVSYFIAGRITTSPAITELIYSLSNLLVLLNDQIIEKSRKPDSETKSDSKLKLLLTTLEYCEVFIELSAKKLWGDKGRWFFIVVVQIIKFIGRLILTFHYKNTIVQSPPIQCLDRKSIEKNQQTNPIDGFENNSSFTFTLKRSGRVVRKVEGAPPVYMRNWKPAASTSTEFDDQNSASDDDVKRIAEILYICKPLIHLTSVATFGYNTWKSWIVAFATDMFSLRLYYTNRSTLTKQQRVELSRRCVCLLLYLMRSPFYDKYSKGKIITLLNCLSGRIPLARTVCIPIIDYIPQWQSRYFYMWST